MSGGDGGDDEWRWGVDEERAVDESHDGDSKGEGVNRGAGSDDRGVGSDNLETEIGAGREDDRSGSDGPSRRPIEPGHPDPENVLFVLLGIALTLFVIYRLVRLFGG